MNARSTAQIFFLSAIWGASFLLIRIAGESFPPFWVALLRSSLGALLLWIVFLGTRQQIPQRSKVPWLLVVGLFNNAIPFTCFAWGERVVPSNIAAVLNATTPIFTLLIGMMIERRRAGWRVVAGVLLGFSGVLLVVLNNVSATSLHVAHATFYDGIILITTGALGYAVATVIAKAKLQGVTPIGIAASQLASASLIVLPLALLGPHPAAVRTSAWMAVIVLGLLGSGVAYLLFFHILRTVSATRTVAVTCLLPVWGVLWGTVAHEPVGALTYIGVAVVITGLAVMNLRRSTVGSNTVLAPRQT
jgi:drug/metabolite transporter (DMT)-like permease